MAINLIMAAADDGGIGLDGELPWHDSEDLRWFKKMTMGGAVIVGYNTFQKLPKLPGRDVHCMERGQDPAKMIHDIYNAVFPPHPLPEIWIAGGSKTYEQFLPLVDKFYISRIRGNFPVDTFASFPLPWSKLKT